MYALAIVIILTAVLVIVLLRWRKKNFEYFRNLGIPGPEPSILCGNLREYHRKGRQHALQEWCDKYGNIFGDIYAVRRNVVGSGPALGPVQNKRCLDRFYNGDVPTLVVKDLDFLDYVFVTNFKNFAERGITMRTDQVHSSLGLSMIHANESQWRLLRGCTSPEFSSCKLKRMMPFLTEQGDIFMEVLGKLADEGKELPMLEAFQALSMDFFCRANFGIDSNFQHTTESLFYTKAENVIPGMMIGPFHAIAQCTTTLGLFMKPFFWINGILGSFTMNIFAEEMKKVVRLRTENPKLRRNDMLQNLFEAELHSKHFTKGGLQDVRRLSEEELVLLTTVLFLGGFQTTAVTLSFMSMLLAMHPEIQEKVRQEVKAAILSSECLDYDTTIHKLKYTTQVMNETLRLYPPSLTFHTRTAKNSFEYKGITFKAGTCIMAPVMQLHRDPQYWTDPNKFDPDRFSPEKEGTYCKRAFQPFGVGPRCCVGYKLALLQVLYFTARMVQNFKMELGEAHKGAIEVHTIGMMASPGDGSWMKFTRI